MDGSRLEDEDNNMKRKWFVRGLKIAVFATIAAAVLGQVVMQLWNWLTPSLFGWHTISFWQALGLLVLSRFFFGGFRGRTGYGMHWRRRMKDRWQQMTPEERDKFRQGMRSRCGQFGAGEPELKV
jgi:hypothetical protein